MAEQANNRCTVMVVDDTPENVDILVDILSDDYKVMVAMDGKSALEDIMKNKPDLILLDVMMPGLNGFDVIHDLKSRPETKEIPVMFVTALGDIKNEEKGLMLGAVDYLTKPVNPSIVKIRVKNHLELESARKELRKRNEILIENAKLRDDVDRIIKHDIKTPLNAVITIPEMILQEGALSKEQKQMLTMIEESGYRILDIVNSSMDLYKMETGAYKPRGESVNVIQLMRQLHGETRSLLYEKNINVFVVMNDKVVNDDDVFYVRGEEMLVYSMLANLVKNAVEASPSGNKVEIILSNSDSPEIRITNKGAIPKEIRETFFYKYVTFGKDGGTGLGAYSAKLIAETLGGKIRFETDEAMGTEIIINLKKPLPDSFTKALKTDEEELKNAEKNPEDLRVLVADDFMNMRKIIRGILRKMRIRNIVEVRTGNEAMDYLESHLVDLIICDWLMPGVSGIEILKFVRGMEIIKDTPFIMVTGEYSKEKVMEAASAGVSGYVIKPFSPDMLVKRINEALGLKIKPAANA